MIISEFRDELEAYQEAFEAFVNTYDLPAELFVTPDHIAIKCADKKDYRQTVHELKPAVDSDGAWELELDDRMLGSAKLAGSASLAGYNFLWLEIMQPRPGKETEKGFVEHTEFTFADFSIVQQTLEQKGIKYTLQENPGHSWVNIVIDELGREIKFNDKPLAEVVAQEKRDGLLKPVTIEV